MRDNRNAGGRGDAPNRPPDGVARQWHGSNAVVPCHAQQERAAGGAVVECRTPNRAPVGKRSRGPCRDRDKPRLAALAPRDRDLTARRPLESWAAASRGTRPTLLEA